MRDRIRWSVCMVALAVTAVRCGGAFTLSDEPDGSTGGYGGTGIDATSPGGGEDDAPGGHPIDASGPGGGGVDGSHEDGGGTQDGSGSSDASDGGVGTPDAGDGGGTHPDASDAGRPDAADDEPGTCPLCGASCCDAGEVCCSSTGTIISIDGGGGSTGGTCQVTCGITPL